MNTKVKRDELLNHLVEVLKKAGSNFNSFDMGRYVAKFGGINSIEGKLHPCGTVACICGFAAIYDRIGSSDFCESEWDSGLLLESMSYSSKMNSILGYNLAQSIYAGDSSKRLSNARQASIFTAQELRHKHLTTKSSFEDSILFLEMIRHNNTASRVAYV